MVTPCHNCSCIPLKPIISMGEVWCSNCSDELLKDLELVEDLGLSDDDLNKIYADMLRSDKEWDSE
jgi:hypothetical protein